MKKLVKPVDINQKIEENYQALTECYACRTCLCDSKTFADDESDDILF